MARRPRAVRTVSTLRKAVAGLRRAEGKVALVPTMGALHDGHMSLIRAARRKAKRVVVSIFVNPAQFAPHEDFSSYPRDFDRDLTALGKLGIDLVWAPADEEMYPQDFSTRIAPAGPANAGLEDAFRPHFFGGVATVVAKLLLQVAPDFAMFGEKDYQQLKVVTRMAKDLDIPVAIVGVPIVREKDGLAMSSRNVYLSPAERQTAPALYQVLKSSAAALKSGKSLPDVLAVGRAKVERAGFVVDYFDARHADTLAPIASARDNPVRLLVAARIGSTRLIDNIAV